LLTEWLLKPYNGAPKPLQSRPVSALQGEPSEADTPADFTAYSFCPLVALRKSASAIGLRQVLPVHTNRTFFVALIVA